MADNPLHEAVDVYTEELWQGGAAMEWLLARGLEEETIERNMLGLVNPIPGHERWRGWISIPYMDARGEVVTIRFRDPGSDANPKYLPIPGTRRHLYNVVASEEERVWLAEGEFDAMILQQMGLPACGVASAAGFFEAWRWLFRDCELVTIVFDGDEAGQSGSKRARTALEGIGLEVNEVRLPIGRDITDYHLEDPKRLRELVA